MTLAASIIIPNWNGAHLLTTCLEALERQTFRDFETIVVDNASTDTSLGVLRQRFPWVRVLRLPRNVFFSGAVNAGIRVAKGDVLVLLNNDTEAEPAWLGELLAALDRQPEAGMATSKLLVFDRRSVLHSAGDEYRLDGRPGNRGVWEEDTGQYDTKTDVFSACGAAAAYRRSMLNEIGLFDEDFVGYCEDVDLSFRAQLAGYRCVFAPAARVYHMISATGAGSRATYLCGRNFINVLVKDMPGPLLKKYAGRIIRNQLSITVQGLRTIRFSTGRGWLLGQLAALLMVPQMLAKRQHIQANRRIDLRQLEAALAGG